MRTIKYDKVKSSYDNAESLKEKILDYKQFTKSVGYRFFFDQDEQILHKKVSPQFDVSCSEMMRHSLKNHKDVRIVVNMNNELLIRLA